MNIIAVFFCLIGLFLLIKIVLNELNTIIFLLKKYWLKFIKKSEVVNIKTCKSNRTHRDVLLPKESIACKNRSKSIKN